MCHLSGMSCRGGWTTNICVVYSKCKVQRRADEEAKKRMVQRTARDHASSMDPSIRLLFIQSNRDRPIDVCQSPVSRWIAPMDPFRATEAD